MIKDYFKLVKFAHTLFALPFALVGYFVGLNQVGEFDWKILVFVLLCMVFARNTAMAFNRYLDRDIDKKNPRTANREIPSGVVKAKNALIFTIVNAILFVVTTFFINRLVFFLSPIAIFVIMFYSYTKRISSLCHLVLGLGLSLSPLGAYLSVTGHFAVLPIMYSVLVLSWCAGFDIIYALQDQEFDKNENLHSIPQKFGTKGALKISSWLHVVSAIMVICIAFLGKFGGFYCIGGILFIFLLYNQHSMVSPEDRSKIQIAFQTLNTYASLIFAFFNILDIYI